MKILPLTATASSLERVWSAQGCIETAKRLSLESDTTDKLVRVYMNLRLEKRLRCELNSVTVPEVRGVDGAAVPVGGKAGPVEVIEYNFFSE
jgi:hypothetical protein